MEPLDKTDNIDITRFVSRKGERTVLSSNKSCNRFPFLDFNSASAEVTESMLLDQLADIVVEMFLEQEHANTKQTSGDLLPSIDERTG